MVNREKEKAQRKVKEEVEKVLDESGARMNIRIKGIKHTS